MILQKRYSEGWDTASVAGIAVGFSLLAAIAAACTTYVYLKRRRLHPWTTFAQSAHLASQRQPPPLNDQSSMHPPRLKAVAEYPEVQMRNSWPVRVLTQGKVPKEKKDQVMAWYYTTSSTKPSTSPATASTQSETGSRYAHWSYRSGRSRPSITSIGTPSHVVKPNKARLKTGSRHISVQCLQMEDQLIGSPARTIWSSGEAGKSRQIPSSSRQGGGYKHQSLPPLQTMSKRPHRNRPAVRDLGWIEDEIVRLKRSRGLST